MNTTISFRPQLFALVKTHKKTVTRRIMNDGDRAQVQKRPYVFGFTYPWAIYSANGRERWREHATIACRDGRTKPADGRVYIHSIRECDPASQITEREAAREGFASANEFIQYWINLNGESSLSLPTWRIEFSYIPKGGYSAGILRETHYPELPFQGDDSLDVYIEQIERIVKPSVYSAGLRLRIIDLVSELNIDVSSCACLIRDCLLEGRKLHEIFALNARTDVK